MKTTKASSLLVFVATIASAASPSFADFYLMQIEQVIGGVDGDMTAQAIQLRMRFPGANALQWAQIRAWDSAGGNPITLIDFDAGVTNGALGARVLIASPNFADYTDSPVQADFVLTNLIPASYLAAGRITYEGNDGVIYWSLSFGGSAYTGPTTGALYNDTDGDFGPSFGGPLPSTGTHALRFQESEFALSVTNEQDYALTPDSALFTNNAGDTYEVVVNAPPVADANGPYSVDEGDSIQLDASGSTDANQSTETLSFVWDLDGDGQFGESGADATRGDEIGISPVFWATELNGPGSETVSLRVTDDGDLQDETTTIINIQNVPPVVQVSPVIQDVQYSDFIADLIITATDVASDSLAENISWSKNGGEFTPGLPSALALSGADCYENGNTMVCTWTLSGHANVAAGTYLVRTTVSDDVDATDADATINILPEEAVVAFDQGNVVAVSVSEPGGNSGPFSLTIDLQELEFGQTLLLGTEPGDINLAEVGMSLVPVGPGGSVAGVCPPGEVSGSGYDAVLSIVCEFDDVPVNTYSASVALDPAGFYYTTAEDVLVVSDPSLGFTTGGGWFYWPGTGERTNVGYNMKYNRRRTNVQGSLLLIRHLGGGFRYRIKSNSLYGLAIGEEDGGSPYGWASYAGKAAYLEPGWPAAEGNYEFVTYVEDHGEPGAGNDRFWIEVINRDGFVVPVSSMPRDAVSHAVFLWGGNIVVPHSDSGGGSPEDAPPVVSIVAPADAAKVSGTEAVSAVAGDDIGVAQVEFFVDGSSIGTDVVSDDGWSVLWDTTALPDGPVAVTAEAADTAGQVRADTINVFVENVTEDAPPAVSIVTPAEGAKVSGAEAVSAVASDDIGVAQVGFFVNGTSIGTDVVSDDGWSVLWDTTALPDGLAAITAEATDTAGQVRADTVDVLVDNVADPSMHIGDLDGRASTGHRGKWDADVTVHVHDAFHDPVDDVAVTGSWSAGASGTSSCVTNVDGWCIISKKNIGRNVDSVTLTVDDISSSLYDYHSAENHDPDGDGDGVSVVVLQP